MLSFYSAKKRRYYLVAKYVFERHFDDCHDPGSTVSGEPNIRSGSFNNVEQFSMDVSFLQNILQ